MCELHVCILAHVCVNTYVCARVYTNAPILSLQIDHTHMIFHTLTLTHTHTHVHKNLSHCVPKKLPKPVI